LSLSTTSSTPSSTTSSTFSRKSEKGEDNINYLNQLLPRDLFTSSFFSFNPSVYIYICIWNKKCRWGDLNR
jgi:hypothetical protein